jgi:hypothetical protein
MYLKAKSKAAMERFLSSVGLAGKSKKKFFIQTLLSCLFFSSFKALLQT